MRSGFRFAPPSNAPLDAQTFRYSIERALDPRLGPRALGINYLGDLVGARAFHAGRAGHVAGIVVRGNRISFTLTRPSPDFLERLALPYFCPVPRTTPILQNGVGLYTGPAPPGAGPYFFWGLVFNGEYAILKRNPNYGGSRPQRLDAIAFREGIDTESAVGWVEQGRYDAIEQYDPLLAPGRAVARRFATAQPPDGVVYRGFPQHFTAYLALNAARPPFSDARLRRAVAAALDRTTLATIANLTPTDRLLPPAVPGAGAPLAQRPDLARARSLAGTTHVAVRMAVQSDDTIGHRLVDAVHTALAPLGIDVQATPVGDLAAALHEPSAHLQLAALTTALDYPDPSSLLAQMLGNDVPAAWLPASTRPAIARLARLTGPARDRAALALAARLAVRDVPVVPYGTRGLGTLAGPASAVVYGTASTRPSTSPRSASKSRRSGRGGPLPRCAPRTDPAHNSLAPKALCLAMPATSLVGSDPRGPTLSCSPLGGSLEPIIADYRRLSPPYRRHIADIGPQSNDYRR